MMEPRMFVSHHFEAAQLTEGAPVIAVQLEATSEYGRGFSVYGRMEVGLVTMADDLMLLTFIMVDVGHRRQGIAGRFLDVLCASADRHGVTIGGRAMALSLKDVRGTMTQGELIDFYGRRGFEVGDGVPFDMIRRPQGSESTEGGRHRAESIEVGRIDD